MKKFLWLSVFLLCFAVSMFGQGARFNGVVTDQTGRPVAAATVYVCELTATGTPCSPHASIFSDVGLTTPMANPITTDNFGRYGFWISPGNYLQQLSGFGINTYTQPITVGGGASGGCPGSAYASSVLFNNAGACDGVVQFVTNSSGNVTIQQGGDFTIAALVAASTNNTYGNGTQFYLQSDGSNYNPDNPDGFQALVTDQNVPPVSAGALTITNIAVDVNGIVTVTASGASTLFNNAPDQYASFSGLTTATFLNGQVLQVLSADSSSFIAASNDGEYDSASDTGAVELQSSSNPVGYTARVGANQWGNATGFDASTEALAEAGNTLIGYRVEPLGDGPINAYGFDSGEQLYIQAGLGESAQFVAESGGETNGLHAYSYKVGNLGYSPLWWVYPDGSEYSRSTYKQIASVSAGSCVISSGLNDCTASVQGGLGPPQTETINFVFCPIASGATGDVIAWAQEGVTPYCNPGYGNFAELFPSSPISLADDITVSFGSATGHTPGATGSFTVTVTTGTDLSEVGGSYFFSTSLPTAGAPVVTPSTSGSTTWEYQVVARFNGAPSVHSTTGTDASGPATLNGTDYETLTIPYEVGATDCQIYRVTAGGTPSSTGLIGSVPCGESSQAFNDTGIAGDSSTPPDTDLTGGLIIANGVIASPLGVTLKIPQISGTGCIGIDAGVISNTASSCSGSGGSPAGELAIQGSSADGTAFVAIPNSSFDPSTGDVTLGAGFTVNSIDGVSITDNEFWRRHSFSCKQIIATIYLLIRTRWRRYQY